MARATPRRSFAAGSTRKALTSGHSEGLRAVRTFDGFAAVSQAAFAVEEGETVRAMGPNRSGKSTIFNDIAGM